MSIREVNLLYIQWLWLKLSLLWECGCLRDCLQKIKYRDCFLVLTTLNLIMIRKEVTLILLTVELEHSLKKLCGLLTFDFCVECTKRRQICNLYDVHNLLVEKIDKQKSRIASASVVLDTVWVGLISGHILVVSTTLPQRALITVKPYI